MNEGDHRAFGAGSRALVDQSDAARLEVRKRRVDILDAKRDVMDAGTAFVEIPGDRRVRRGTA